MNLAEHYTEALGQHDVDRILAMLSADVVFRSPFNTWRGEHIRNVYLARGGAIDNLTIDTVIQDRDHAVLLWHATVGAAELEASEVLSITDNAIRRVDVYIRPADVLSAVHAAMVEAWPQA